MARFVPGRAGYSMHGNAIRRTHAKVKSGLSWSHGLRTPNEGINQRYLQNWADVADKIASAVPNNLGLGLNFRPCSEGYFLSGRP